jgi:hypothetical protein
MPEATKLGSSGQDRWPLPAGRPEGSGGWA